MFAFSIYADPRYSDKQSYIYNDLRNTTSDVVNALDNISGPLIETCLSSDPTKFNKCPEGVGEYFRESSSYGLYTVFSEDYTALEKCQKMFPIKDFSNDKNFYRYMHENLGYRPLKEFQHLNSKCLEVDMKDKPHNKSQMHKNVSSVFFYQKARLEKGELDTNRALIELDSLLEGPPSLNKEKCDEQISIKAKAECVEMVDCPKVDSKTKLNELADRTLIGMTMIHEIEAQQKKLNDEWGIMLWKGDTKKKERPKLFEAIRQYEILENSKQGIYKLYPTVKFHNRVEPFGDIPDVNRPKWKTMGAIKRGDPQEALAIIKETLTNHYTKQRELLKERSADFKEKNSCFTNRDAEDCDEIDRTLKQTPELDIQEYQAKPLVNWNHMAAKRETVQGLKFAQCLNRENTKRDAKDTMTKEIAISLALTAIPMAGAVLGPVSRAASATRIARMAASVVSTAGKVTKAAKYARASMLAADAAVIGYFAKVGVGHAQAACGHESVAVEDALIKQATQNGNICPTGGGTELESAKDQKKNCQLAIFFSALDFLPAASLAKTLKFKGMGKHLKKVKSFITMRKNVLKSAKRLIPNPKDYKKYVTLMGQYAKKFPKRFNEFLKKQKARFKKQNACKK